MIWHMLLSVLATAALLLADVGVVRAHDRGAPMIVVFRDGAALEGFGGFYQADERARRDPEGWGYLDRNVVGAVQALEAMLGFRADHVYSAALRGFAARLTARQLRALRSHPLVRYVEPDGIMTAKAQTLPWGIDRIDADLSSTLAGDGSGAISNVNVYIIDTGIDAGIDSAQHDLNVVGHVKMFGLRFLGNADCNGHGTHVAGTASAIDNTADVVGAAPGAPLTGVKVLDCSGSGSTSGVIKGVDWVTANGQTPAVANMSLGGGPSQALDDAVIASVAAGFFYAVAAGNEADDACNYSPARVGPNSGVMTVAATDQSEEEASFSNFGDCVDIWAPGVQILSTKLRGGTTTLSGTSMASPHVAGGAALYLSNNPSATPAQVESALASAAASTGTVSKDGRAIMRLDVGSF